MKIKSQLSIFNVITRLILILVLVFTLPLLVEQVVYKHINKTLLEKKQKFIRNLGSKEINQFINESENADTYASFSILHDEFILLSQLQDHPLPPKSVFITEPRIIEGQQDDYRILQYTFNYNSKSYQFETGSSISEIRELTFMIRIFTLVVLFVIVLVTFLIDSFFIDYLLSPFYKIIDTKIRRVNDPDSFNFTAIKSHSEDFRELDEVLNQMMERIDSLFKKEKQFIANVSHELLTPISLLKNRFENLLQNETLNEEAVDKIVSSLRTLDMIKKIINNLLLISKIENNQFTESEEIDLEQLILDIKEETEDRIAEKQLRLEINFENRFIFTANKTLIYILIYNLVSNAIKYNSEKGFIKIKGSFRNNQFCLSVTDSGKGLTAQEAQSVFKRFTRMNHDQEGQGLGLAIVDSIAHFHHIKIEIESISGRGSSFLVFFPLDTKS